MKLWVEHDRFGTIRSVCVAAKESRLRVVPVARAGLTVSEVDAPGFTSKPGTPAFNKEVRRLMKSSVVRVGEATLVKKLGKSKGGRRKR